MLDPPADPVSHTKLEVARMIEIDHSLVTASIPALDAI
jgi:hypothetical protein